MTQVVFNRKSGDGLIYSAVWISDLAEVKLQFVNDLAALDLTLGKRYEVYWRMAGEKSAKLEIFKTIGDGKPVQIVNDAMPSDAPHRNFALFIA